MKKTLVLLPFLFACATTGKTGDQTTETKKKSTVAAKLPDFTLDTVDGDQFTLSDHVGQKVVVLSFWATWCEPCLDELPHLDEIYQKEKDRGLLIVAISMDEPTTVAEVAPTVRRIGLTMPVLLDPDQRAQARYLKGDPPYTVVIDKKGIIVSSHAGYTPGDEEKLAAEIQSLL